MKNDTDFARTAKVLTEVCFRDTKLEELHSGVYPASAVGDYSDVRVVTPYGEIPWSDVSRLNDEEMKSLMMEAVDRVFTFLQHSDVLTYAPCSGRWREPRLNGELMIAVRAHQRRTSSKR